MTGRCRLRGRNLSDFHGTGGVIAAGAAFVSRRIHGIRATRMWMSCVAGSVETS